MRDVPSRVNIRDIARAADTSVSTVSRALNDHPDVSAETRDRILQVASSLGYERNVLAHSLISGRSGMIAVIFPDIDFDYMLQFLRGITHAVERLDRELLLAAKSTPEQVVSACWSMHRRGIADGAVIFAAPPEREADLLKLVAAGFSIVAFHPHHPLLGVTCVEPMDYEGGRLAVQHLLELGHRRIGIIVEAPGRTAGRERLRGYRDALVEAGICYDESLVAAVEPNQPLASGRAAMRSWLEQGNQPSAVFCFNDPVAYGAIAELREWGLAVPEQVSVVGFDDIPASGYFGSGGLTTVRQPITEMGELALETLLRLCDGEVAPGQVIRVPVELVVRGTTGPVRAAARTAVTP